MKTPTCTWIDFETKGIEDRPKYPPEPVGLATMHPGEKPRYYAFGHPANNGIYEPVGRNKVKRLGPCTKEDATRAACKAWGGKYPIGGQNLKFDVDVAEVHLGVPVPEWDRIHDTQYLLFLKDPHAESLSLKPSAERYLKRAPEERDALRGWLVEKKIITSDASQDVFGANIWRCPGDLTALYACQDLLMARDIHDLLFPEIVKAGMHAAYERERRIMVPLLRNEQRGMRFDVERAAKDVPAYEKAIITAEEWLRKRLKIKDSRYESSEGPGFNFATPAHIARALDEAKVVTEWTRTKKSGKISVSKKNLTKDKFNDLEVFRVLGYRNRLTTVMQLNLRPWYAMAASAEGKGRVYTSWNQVRRTRVEGESKGTRSGRISCSRFQNISKDFTDKGDGYEHPTKIKVPELPLVRKYLLPEKGGVFCHRDYNQQEFRILAHYEDGAMLEEYLKAPRTDYHNMMQARVKAIVGKEYERRLIKNINFAINYGTGLATLAATAKIDIDLAGELRSAAKKAVPDVIALDAELKDMGRSGKPIRTWGGRLYYCEPPGWSEKFGREMTYEYKLLNYLIQGSAADCTKEALARLFDHPKYPEYAEFLVTVHDEINSSARSAKAVPEVMKITKEVMESIEFDVPMLSDAKSGPSWGDLKKYEEKDLPWKRKAA